MTFFHSSGGPCISSNGKKQEKARGADFYQIPFFSKWLWVTFFAIFYQMVSLILLITPKRIDLPTQE